MALTGCGSSGESTSFNGDGGDLGQGDTAILNAFYGYKQLTVSFLAGVTTGGAAVSAAELDILTQIYRHEVAHLSFLKALLGVEAIPDLTGFDFTSVPLSARDRILHTVREFEDVGAAGYAGSLRYLTQVKNVQILAQIASVDSRHSSLIRDVIDPGKAAFANSDVVGSKTGLERRYNPYFVFSVVRSYGPLPVLSTGNLP